MLNEKFKPANLTVAHVATEFFPFAKTGGLASVVLELATATRNIGSKVAVFLPLWGGVLDRLGEYDTIATDVPIKIDSETTLTCSFIHKELVLNESISIDLYFVNHYDFFGRYSKNYYHHPETPKRFYFFSLAVLELMKLINLEPDIIHLHDWMVSLIPQIVHIDYKKYFVKEPKTLVTIHNLAFQGSSSVNVNKYSSKEIIKKSGDFPKFTNNAAWDKINFLRRGVYFADKVNTISTTYAKEILTTTYGENMQALLKSHGPIVGIINGIDPKLFNPQTSTYLYKNYNAITAKTGKLINKKRVLKRYKFPASAINKPLFVMVHRITEQKGYDLLVKSMEVLMQFDITMIVMGEGDHDYESKLKRVEQDYPKKFHFINRMSETLEHRLDAAGDFMIAPSHYEPCGTSHLKAMSYGVVPIARSTGGLADTIFDYSPKNNSGTGILFANMETSDLVEAVKRGLELYENPEIWNQLVQRNMARSFSWEKSVLDYLQLYRTMLGIKDSK